MPILLGPSGLPLPPRLQQVPAAPPQVFDEPLLPAVPTGMPILLDPSGLPLPPRLQQVPAAPPQVFDEPLEFPTDEDVKNEAEGGGKSKRE